MKTAWAVATLLALALPGESRASEGLDVRGWLSKPNVRLLAVELYATWCKPCMAAVPRWKKLHEAYRGKGLRFVVVATRDPGGACKNPGWTPDAVVCDDEGVIAQALGAGDELPAAFLWSWQGHLLVRKGHVDQVEQAIGDWMKETQRVEVEAEPAAGVAAKDLVDLVRGEIDRSGKVMLVANEAERTRLHALVASSFRASADDALQCEVGKDISANSLLKARVSTSKLLYLNLFSAERGCLVAAGSAAWDPKRPKAAVAEAVAELLGRLSVEPEMARIAARSTEADVTPRRKSGALDDVEEVAVRFESTPDGAAVLEGTKLLCAATPCSKALTAGTHRISMQKERFEEKVDLVAVSATNKKVAWTLAPDFGWLTLRSEPSGLEVAINGEVVGQTPLVRRELSPGAYELRVRGPCHFEWAKKGVSIARGAEREESAKLEPRVGGVKVTVQDARGDDVEGDVFVDGAKLGRAPGKALEVSVCAKALEVRSDAGTWRGPLAVEEGRVTRVVAKLEAPRPEVKAEPGARFVDQGDRTVLDTKTGLTWAASDSFVELGKCLDWNGATAYASGLALGGRRDWRLPTGEELIALYDGSHELPAPFRAATASYWSSTGCGADCRNTLWLGSPSSPPSLSPNTTTNCYTYGVRPVRDAR